VIVRILIIAAVVLFLIMWVRALMDLFGNRPDLGGGAKVAWAIGMLVFPFLGLLVYMMLRPSEATISQNARR
jgi:Phospholipase_D-nuclease N-terminal